MIEPEQEEGVANDADAQDIEAIYGKQGEQAPGLEQLADMRNDFAPWHHPVKQIVRTRQWAALTKKLIEARPAERRQVLKYFTLPGADLLDVRTLAAVCEPLGVKIEYFGFNSGGASADPGGVAEDGVRPAAWVMAESALRQAGRITEDAVILEDQLEDIAETGSQAAIQLQQRGTFDVINIDPCDHLAYRPKGRTKNTFNALEALLKHQMGATSPWLLFVTTRVSPELLGQPGVAFQNAITQNLGMPESGFGASLAECISANAARIGAELSTVWSTHDERFLRLYSVGLGKYLLQFFHAQPNMPANVELASVYAYRVYSDQPDMLALAFQITPDPKRVFAPQVGNSVAFAPLEPARAVSVAKRAMRLEDIDGLIAVNEYIRNEAVEGTKSLLQTARFDLEKWAAWLAGHSRRPMTVTQDTGAA
jgi:hypothetical protein